MSHYPQCATRKHFYAKCNCLVIAVEDNARAIREHTINLSPKPVAADQPASVPADTPSPSEPLHTPYR